MHDFRNKMLCLKMKKISNLQSSSSIDKRKLYGNKLRIKQTLDIHMLNIAGAKWDEDLHVACHRGKTGRTTDLFYS